MRTPLGVALLAIATTAHGATFVVTNSAATGPGSLQQAIRPG